MESLRMCVCCRQMLPKSNLVRVAKAKDGTLCLDKSGKMPGRGAYVCASEQCLALLKKNKCLNRAFRRQVDTELLSQVEEEILVRTKQAR